MTNKVFTGKVAKINFKEITNPTDIDKQYDYKFKMYMEVCDESGNEFFTVGSGKDRRIPVQVNNKYESLQIGDTITFVYTENTFNDKIYKHVKRSAINVLERNANAPSNAVRKAGNSAVAAPAASNHEVGIAVGHAVNNAVHITLASLSKSELANNEKVAAKLRYEAERILRLSEELRGDYDAILAPPAIAQETVDEDDDAIL
jgi:hypothetical protein